LASSHTLGAKQSGLGGSRPAAQLKTAPACCPACLAFPPACSPFDLVFPPPYPRLSISRLGHLFHYPTRYTFTSASTHLYRLLSVLCNASRRVLLPASLTTRQGKIPRMSDAAPGAAMAPQANHPDPAAAAAAAAAAQQLQQASPTQQHQQLQAHLQHQPLQQQSLAQQSLQQSPTIQHALQSPMQQHASPQPVQHAIGTPSLGQSSTVDSLTCQWLNCGERHQAAEALYVSYLTPHNYVQVLTASTGARLRASCRSQEHKQPQPDLPLGFMPRHNRKARPHHIAYPRPRPPQAP
jgi:hypothetical protein